MDYKDQLKEIKLLIDTEGMDEAFAYDYQDIDNVTFHKLREAYLKAKDRLEKYVRKHSKD